ncbi:MAG: Lrp/AsnC family transcriptional regulator [Rhodoferax sp.]
MNTNNDDDLLLDKFDIGLLAALQTNALLTHQQLSEQVHLSASQVSRRIQRLRDSGLIQRVVALLDPAMAGLGVRALAYVTLARHGGDESRAFERCIAEVDEVLECYAVAGDADYILHIVAADLHTLSDSVLARLMRMPGIAHIRSNIVLQRVKSQTRLPLDHLGRGDRRGKRVRLA